MKINDLIVIKQLPIIEQMLDKISIEIDKKTSQAEYVLNVQPKEILRHDKKLRAELNKYFNSLEERRKDVKISVLKPYNDFEKIYKEKITDKFKKADELLKSRIDGITETLKEQKVNVLKEYFLGQCDLYNIDFLKFEDMNLKINLSDSLKSQFEKIRVFVENVKKGLDIINKELDENKRIDLMFEFRKNFNIVEALEVVQKKQEQISKINSGNNNVLHSVENDKTYTITLKLKGTKEKLKILKKYINELEIEIL